MIVLVCFSFPFIAGFSLHACLSVCLFLYSDEDNSEKKQAEKAKLILQFMHMDFDSYGLGIRAKDIVDMDKSATHSEFFSSALFLVEI